jgi:hypothetical protein
MIPDIVCLWMSFYLAQCGGVKRPDGELRSVRWRNFGKRILGIGGLAKRTDEVVGDGFPKQNGGICGGIGG